VFGEARRRRAPQMIADEDYWRRRASARWRNLDAAAHGRSWKQLFFERNLDEALERCARARARACTCVQRQARRGEAVIASEGQRQPRTSRAARVPDGGHELAAADTSEASGAKQRARAAAKKPRPPGRYDPASGGAAALRRLMAFSRRFARSVRPRQLPSRLDPQLLLDAMGK
jgi:hypothetical protein